MNPVIRKIREELHQSRDDATLKTAQRFFKEEILCYGVKTGTVKKIADRFWKEVKSLDKTEIFRLCEELYQSHYCEEAFIVSFWVPGLKDRFEKEDLTVFKRWIETYISNWAMCDGFCNHAVGDFIGKYPECMDELKHWTRSENRWMRRASAVSLIVPAKRGMYLDTVLEIASLLLTDDDDMVRKGYGWLLKEASRKHQNEVFEFVMRNRKAMPRTALRYAIELMPKALRTEAMKRDW
jgi:3-methyladenine DNA glycosylase AlkD